MTNDMGLDIEGPLKKHTPFTVSHGVVRCGCTYGGNRADLPDMSWPQHSEHVAAVLREHIAAWLADFPWTETARDDLLAAVRSPDRLNEETA